MPETITSQPRRPLARPERTRLALSDDAAGATPPQLPRPNAGIALAGNPGARTFAIFAGARTRRSGPAEGGRGARVRSDSGGGGRDLGTAMPRPAAGRLAAAIRGARPAATAVAPRAEAAAAPESAPRKIDPPAEAAPRP